MKKRRYQQYCPIAYSLDIIGERWTLLIVRELGLGARRFTDLQRGLPTMGSNLLSHRLKSLEESEVIKAVPLPPPARVTAYQLTEAGKSLAQAMVPLVQWGMNFMPNVIPDDEFVGAIQAISALRLMHQPTLGAEESLSAEIHIKPDVFRITLQRDEITIEQSYASEAPLVLHTEPKAIFHMVHEGYPPQALAEKMGVSIERGDPDLVNRFFSQFTLPYFMQP